jgi:hypothetical protein
MTTQLQAVFKELYGHPSVHENYPIFEIQMPKYATLDIGKLFGGRIEFNLLFSIIVEQKMFEMIAAYFTTPTVFTIFFQDVILFLLKISDDFKFEGINMKIIISQFKFLYHSLRIYKRVFDFQQVMMIKWGLYAMILLDLRTIKARKELFSDLEYEIFQMYPEAYKSSGFELIGTLIKYEKF